ncbi:hypothetical protein soil367_16940 [Hydrocarboniclastica marina]|uniref:Uncharacterized protein n=1 Tax=Hydrocarboniclastica marina TaxID=2259620 RepID=A0A4P7XLP0_9ALTE|nr:hypothetical protein soil367_16940 [Hydrocarboniclastica marina]
MKITYTIPSGKRAGTVCTPHRHADGRYVVSRTRFKKDYVFVRSVEQIARYLDRGFCVRMSDPVTKTSPSLITKASLEITEDSYATTAKHTATVPTPAQKGSWLRTMLRLWQRMTSMVRLRLNRSLS